MARAKMAAALQGSSVSARELGLPLGEGHVGRMGVANCDAAGAGPGVLADRAGGMSVADNTKADVFARDRGVSSSAKALLCKNGPAGLAVSDGLHGKTGAPLVEDEHLAGGMSVAGTNAEEVFAREAVPVKNHPTWLGVGVADGFARQRDMSFGEVLLGKNLPVGLRVVDCVARETDAHLRDKKFFGEDYYSARKTGAPTFAGLVAADEHGVHSDKARTVAAGEAPLKAPSAPLAEQVTIDVPKAEDTAAGADAGNRGGNLSTVVGIVAASSAVTMLAAGAVTPPVAFATFLFLLGGLFVAVSGVLED